MLKQDYPVNGCFGSFGVVFLILKCLFGFGFGFWSGERAQILTKLVFMLQLMGHFHKPEIPSFQPCDGS